MADRSQNPDEGARRPSKQRGRRRASTISSAGVSVRVATSVKASPTPTLGPVLENSLNLFMPISDRPTITVAALVSSGVTDRGSARRIAPAGSAGSQCSANRQEMNRQKSVPHAEEDDDQEQLDQRRELPPGQRHPGQHPPGDHQADADGRQRHQGQPDRAIDRQQDPQQEDDRGRRGAVERDAGRSASCPGR